MIENGLDPEDLLGRRFGHHLNFWSMSQRKLTQRIDLGDAHQMVLELRPALTSKAFGFVGVVISVEDLSASVFLWHQDGDRWAARKVITIPAEPADPDLLPRPSSPSGPCPHWSATSTCRWMTAGCTCRVGAPASSSSTTSATRTTRARPARSAWAASCAASPTPPHPTSASVAAPDGRGQPRRPAGLCDQLALRPLDDIFYPEGVGAWMAKLDAGQEAASTPTRGSSPTATTSGAAGGSRGPASKAATPPATPTPTPAAMHLLAHHLGEDSLVNLLLVGGAGSRSWWSKAAPGWRPPGPG